MCRILHALFAFLSGASCPNVSPSDSDCFQAVDVLLLFLSLGLGFVCVLLALQMSRPTFFHLGLANCCSFLVLFMTVKSCVSREFSVYIALAQRHVYLQLCCFLVHVIPLTLRRFGILTSIIIVL